MTIVTPTLKLVPLTSPVPEFSVAPVFTHDNVRSIRPGHGIHTRNFNNILGRKAIQEIEKGTPLQWGLIK
mgnify:CR=1 FL=1